MKYEQTYLTEKRKLDSTKVFWQKSSYGEAYIGLNVHELCFEEKYKLFAPRQFSSYCINRYILPIPEGNKTIKKWLFDKPKYGIGNNVCMAYLGELQVGQSKTIHLYITEGFLDGYSLMQSDNIALKRDGRHIFMSHTGGVGAIFAPKMRDNWKYYLSYANDILVCLDNDTVGKEYLLKGVKTIADYNLHSTCEISWGHCNGYKDCNEALQRGAKIDISILFQTNKHTHIELSGLRSQYIKYHTMLSDEEKAYIAKLDKLLGYSPPVKLKSVTRDNKRWEDQQYPPMSNFYPEVTGNKVQQVRCPQHTDKNPSATYIPAISSRAGKELIHCFVCNKTFDSLQVKKFKNL